MASVPLTCVPVLLGISFGMGACEGPPARFSAAQARARSEGGRTLLHGAALAGDLRSVRALLEVGADPEARDDREWTAMHLAAMGGDERIVSALAAAGGRLDSAGQYDMTPLHWAALLGRATTTRALLERGAAVGARNIYGMTPLHESATAAVTRLLIAAGSDLDAVDNWGLTPLHRARGAETAQALIDAGADMMATSPDGRAPVHMFNIVSQEGPLIAVLPRTATVRLLEEYVELPVRVRNLEATPLDRVTWTASADAARIRLEPTGFDRIEPAQMVSFRVVAERLPGVEPTEDSVRVNVFIADAPAVAFKLRLNTMRGETPEDRGMIRVGKLNVRPPPSRWQWFAYAGAPMALAFLWAAHWLRSRRRRAADADG